VLVENIAERRRVFGQNSVLLARANFTHASNIERDTFSIFATTNWRLAYRRDRPPRSTSTSRTSSTTVAIVAPQVFPPI
jgi:hypothetical protein